MNKIHRVVWNEITATWVAVAEIAKGASNQEYHYLGASTILGPIGKAFADEASAIEHMVKHKAETGLKFFETKVEWSPPDYIARAVISLYSDGD